MKIYKLLLAAAGTTVLFAALASSASARSFSVSNQRIRSSWREVIFETFINVNCQVTLEGSLHGTTIPKVIGSLIGYITSAILGPCLEGTATILRETLPWHVRYSGFEPRLPEIRSIIVHVTNASFRVREFFGITCLARSEAANPVIGRFHRNPATHELTGVSIGGTIPCEGLNGNFRSSEGTVSLQGTTSTRISVSLI